MIPLRGLIAFSILLIAIPDILAALRPEIAINDELRICKDYQPSGLYELPAGWRFQYESQTLNAKTICPSGYTQLPEGLEGVMRPYYRNWSNALFIGMLALFIAGCVLIIRLYKSKKKKFGIRDYVLLLLFFVILLVLLAVLRSIIWGFIDPCNAPFGLC